MHRRSHGRILFALDRAVPSFSFASIDHFDIINSCWLDAVMLQLACMMKRLVAQ
jgi:hypothetical protein